MQVFTEIFGNPSTGMLFDEFVKNKKIATSVAAYYYPDGFGDTSFTISIVPKKGITLNKIESELNIYLKEIKEKVVSKDELKSIKKRLVNETIFAQDSLYMGMRIFGSSLSTGYSLKDIIDWSSDIQKVSLDDIQNILSKIFDSNKSVTGLLLPIDK